MAHVQTPTSRQATYANLKVPAVAYYIGMTTSTPLPCIQQLRSGGYNFSNFMKTATLSAGHD
eukprot:161849-Amphidinium_carterae.1